ncbi:MAG: outer membrane lipoprotein carrier protein LolA [Bacteroidetes bacterium]|nr:outer membrane lipoprotein carrier protein LolA [Bacteroidota bacterium]
MEYTQPFQYLIIINQNRIYIKDRLNENTISTKGNKLFRQISQIIADCVQGTILNNPEFKISIFESDQAYKIEMIPTSKDLKDFFKNINITVNKKTYTISKFEMIELTDDNTIISFLNRENNTNIPDALFYIK